MSGSIIAEAPVWVQAVLVLAIGACLVAILHIIREVRYWPDPYSHDIRLIPTAHEGRLIPIEDERDREWREII